MKTLNAFALLVLLVSLPLLLGGCGEKQSIAETKLLKEKQQEVKPEEPVAETKPTEAVSVDPIKCPMNTAILFLYPSPQTHNLTVLCRECLSGVEWWC